MMNKKLVAVILILGILLVVGYTNLSGYFVKTQTATETAIVARVIDGDTVQLTDEREVRLLGINAPEKQEPYYQESKNRLKALIENRTVSLEKDKTDKDIHRRSLRYVFVDDIFINLKMIEEGYATVYIIPPDEKYSSQLLKAENEAKQKKIGIWKASEVAGCIEIINFHYNAEGNDNENLNDEYVVFRNNCSFVLNMDGWELKDEGTNIYKFSSFSLLSEDTVTLYSGSGKNTDTNLYWNRKTAVWNNDGDTLYIRDKDGSLILSYTYPS